MASSRPCNDVDLGPIVASSCRGGFDFTLLFEQLCFSLFIAAVSTIAFAIRLAQLPHAPNLLPRRRDMHLAGKLVLSVTLVVCNAVLVAYWALHPATAASIPSAVVELVASLLLCALSWKAHCSTPRPSFSLGLALLASIAGQAILIRTLWLIPGARQPAILTSVGLTLRCCLLALDSLAKSLPTRLGSLPPEALAGPISRAFLWWVNEILARGWRTRLSLDHLFELDAHLDSKFLQDKLAKSRGAGGGLLRAICLALRWPMLATIIPRLLLCAFNVSQPLLVEAATEYLSFPEQRSNHNTAYGLIGVTAIIYIGIAISTAAYKANLVRTIAMMRGALVASIYGKTLELSTRVVSKRAATTLMSTDVERIAFGMLNAHEAWASPVEVIIAIYLLQRQIGYITIVPVVVAIVCSALVYWIATLVRKNQREWNEAVERRVGETSIVISKIEGVKAAGLTDHMRGRIQSLRVAELEACKRYRRLQVGKNVLSNTPALLSPILIFLALVYSSSTKTLDGSRAFTTLAIIQIMTTPLQVALTALPVLVGAFGCFDRIQAYLDQTLSNSSRRSLQDLAYRPWTKGDDFELRDVNVELDGKAILRDVTHCFPAGSVSLIVGPSGVGKSTMLLIMLGELPLKSGTMSTRSSIVAYCSQEPWLQNGSIRDIIVSDSLWDQDWYSEVAHACCLNGDLKMMPDGDLTRVSSGGASLSEGQRKKLVLARAVYCRAPLVLLDDCFNGMDHDTQLVIASRLLGPDGLLRRMQCTTVLTASSAVLDPFVDYVVTLSTNGRFVPLMPQASAPVVSPCEAVIPNPTTSHEIHKGEALTSNLFDSSLVVTSAQPQPVISYPKEAHQEKGSLAVGETVVSITSNLSDDDGGRTVNDRDVYIYYLRTMGYGLISLFFGVIVIEIFLEKFPQAWLNLWVTAETQSPGEHTVMYLVVYGALAVLGLAVLGGVIWLWFVVLLPKSANELHRILLNAVIGAPVWFLSQTGMGNVINRFSQDMELVDMDLPLAFYHTVFSALLCLASLILISSSGQYVAIIIPFSLVFVCCLQKFYLRTSRQLRLLDLETKAPLYEHFLEPAQGVSTIRAFGWSDNHLSRLLSVLNTSQRPFYLLYMIQRWLNLVLDLFVAALAVIVITMAVLIPSGSTSASLGLAMINLLGFNTALAELIDAWTTLETSLGAVARLISFEKSTPVERLGTDVHVPDVPHDWPSRGLIELKDLTCGYGPAGAPVLKSIDLTIQPGEVLGIDGASGSGKSTLLKSIIGLATIQSGSIIIDSLPAARVDPETVRSRIITVPQDPFYPPNATLKSAMLPPPPLALHPPVSSCEGGEEPQQQHRAGAVVATDEAILSALENVQILADLSGRAARGPPDDAHVVFPDPSAACLSCPLGDLNLSQSERQLLSMARACLQAEVTGARVVLFDEPIVGAESSGDLDRVFARIVKEKLKGCTVIVVSHRVATLGVADRIVHLEHGSVAAE